MTTSRVEADFDHRSLSWLAERHAHNAELRERSPVVWNPRYGGFWFVSGYKEVAAVARGGDSFTARYEEKSPDGLEYIGGIGIPRPEGLPTIGVGEVEGERHAALRRAINPFVLPAAVAKDRPFAEQAACWFMDRVIERGRMDMVNDYTSPVPSLWTMKLVDLPPENWTHYADYFHALAAYSSDMPEYQQAHSRTPEMLAGLIDIIERRRIRPGNDLLSALTTMEIDGKTLQNDELIAALFNLIGGGLDTTTSPTSLALADLGDHPDLRRRLADNPDLLSGACEEYLRWTSVSETQTYTCIKDTELGGQLIKRGDFLMISWLGANFDPAVFGHPAEVDIDRKTNAHLAFGVGAHRCIGMHVARMLFEVMMRQVLDRIPDYVVDLANTQFYQGSPQLYGVVKMLVTFTPGPPAGAVRPY
jgi:cytochrome P450